MVIVDLNFKCCDSHLFLKFIEEKNSGIDYYRFK